MKRPVASWPVEAGAGVANITAERKTYFEVALRLDNARSPEESVRILTDGELRWMAMHHFSGREEPACAECGGTDIRTLTLNHIDHNGSEHRRIIRREGFSNIYKWLAYNGFPDHYYKGDKRVPLRLNILCNNHNTIDAKMYDQERQRAKKFKAIAIQTGGRNCCEICSFDNRYALIIVFKKDNMAQWCDERGVAQTNHKTLTRWLSSYIVENGKQHGLMVICKNCDWKYFSKETEMGPVRFELATF